MSENSAVLDAFEDNESYQLGYDEACEMTNELLANTLETCESFRKLNHTYYQEIQRLRGLLGLPAFPLIEKVAAS